MYIRWIFKYYTRTMFDRRNHKQMHIGYGILAYKAYWFELLFTKIFAYINVCCNLILAPLHTYTSFLLGQDRQVLSDSALL